MMNTIFVDMGCDIVHNIKDKPLYDAHVFNRANRSVIDNLTKKLAEEITNEIDREIIKDILSLALELEIESEVIGPKIVSKKIRTIDSDWEVSKFEC